MVPQWLPCPSWWLPVKDLGQAGAEVLGWQASSSLSEGHKLSSAAGTDNAFPSFELEDYKASTESVVEVLSWMDWWLHSGVRPSPRGLMTWPKSTTFQLQVVGIWETSLRCATFCRWTVSSPQMQLWCRSIRISPLKIGRGWGTVTLQFNRTVPGFGECGHVGAQNRSWSCHQERLLLQADDSSYQNKDDVEKS